MIDNPYPVPLDHGEINRLLMAQWVLPDLHARPRKHWQQRLAIIVPYRDRAAHLSVLVPYLHDYFQIDKLDCEIPFHLHIAEQCDDRPFNRGRLINASFAVVGNQADYLCFHDVDLLPVWADYAFTPRPARLVWHGSPNTQQRHLYIGGVCAMSCADFRTLNGFSNDYWGWGYEDHDLRLRMVANGLRVEARDGAYRPQPHPHNGFTTDGRETEAGRRNRERIEALHRDGFTAWRQDGLNNVTFRHLGSAPLALDGKTWPHATHHRFAFD